MKINNSHYDIKLLKYINVLYVEDDPLVAAQTLELLKRLCQNVFYCGNAEDALILLEDEKIHIVITDIELPGMSGLELCKRIRSKNSNIPIFITSVYNNKEKLLEAIKLNLVNYLIKPVSITSITQTLLGCIQKLQEDGTFMIRLNSGSNYCPMLGQVEMSGNIISLTRAESILLDLLIHHKNQIVHYDSIEYAIHSEEPMSESAFKNLIYRLRKKVGKDSIVAVSGVGIKLISSNV